VLTEPVGELALGHCALDPVIIHVVVSCT